jgi:hypothetical protein
MLKAVNEHLAKVPLFGLGHGPLGDGDVLVTSILTQSGAELDLATRDLKYCLYYDNGVLRKAVALEAEMTGLFRDPAKFQHFGDHAGTWSKEEASRAAEALIHAKGIDLGAAGAVRGPVVRPETFDLPTPEGVVKPVTAFYTVRWIDHDGDDVLEIRFRRTESGTWEPTQWFDNTRKTTDIESTSYTNLYRRFFVREKP